MIQKLTKLESATFDAHYVHAGDLRLSLELMNSIEKFFRVGLLIGVDVVENQMAAISLLCRDLICLGGRQFDICGTFAGDVEDIVDRIFIEKLSTDIIGSAGEVTTTSVTSVAECLLMCTYNRLGGVYLREDWGLLIISLGEVSYNESTLVSMLRRTADC